MVRVTGAAPAVPASGVAVENAGDIFAAGGTILLHGELADGLLDTVVNNSGLLQADGLAANPDGTISLVANGGDLVVAGTVGAGGGQVVLASSGRIDLGATLVAGALEIGADSLEQDPGGGAVTVTGTASIQAAGDATFNRGGNDFAGTVDLAVGGHALLVDANGITLRNVRTADLSVQANGSITLDGINQIRGNRAGPWRSGGRPLGGRQRRSARPRAWRGCRRGGGALQRRDHPVRRVPCRR